MLQKRRDMGSIPDGLCKTAAEMKKGMVVTRKYNSDTKEFELAFPQEGDSLYGFVTLRIDEKTHKGSYYDTIPKGVRATCYTLVKHNEWATDQFTGELAVGDKASVGTDGKLVKQTSPEKAVFEVIGLIPAMGGYEYPMVEVKVL